MINYTSLSSIKIASNLKGLEVMDKTMIKQFKAIVKNTLNYLELQVALRNTDNNLRSDIFFSILNHEFTNLVTLLKTANISINGLEPKELASTILYCNNPKIDSVSLFSGHKIFNATTEKFLFALFGIIDIYNQKSLSDSQKKEILIKTLVGILASNKKVNSEEFREFVSVYLNKGYKVLHDPLFFILMYDLGVKKFYNLDLSLSLINKALKGVELYGCSLCNMEFTALQESKLIGCNILQGTKIHKLVNSKIIDSKINNTQIKMMNTVDFINCREASTKIVSGETIINSTNSYETIKNVIFYRNDNNYLGVHRQLKPFTLDKNRRLIESSIAIYSMRKSQILPGSTIHLALENSNCAFSLTDFKDLTDTQAIVIITSNKSIIINEADERKTSNCHHLFYIADLFKLHLLNEYEKSGNINQTLVPQNKYPFIISLENELNDIQDNTYYTFFQERNNNNEQ